MQDLDEAKHLVKSFSDKSRKVARVGSKFIVPHKFTENGEVLTEENFSAKKDISRLNLSDLRFLEIWRDNKWNDEETVKKSNLSPEQAERTFKKLKYFKTEDARIKALASQATPERVLAKDMENLETGILNDSQHKSLDRVAKITGAFKTTTDINITHSLEVPKLNLEAWEAIKKIADIQADVIDVEAA